MHGKPYNFDNRLIGLTIAVSSDNYVSDMLKINGIYYAVDQTLSFGSSVTITAVTGNILSVTSLPKEKETLKHDHHFN